MAQRTFEGFLDSVTPKTMLGGYVPTLEDLARGRVESQRVANIRDMWSLERAGRRGFHSMQSMAGGAVGIAGEVLGSERIKQAGLNYAAEAEEQSSMVPGRGFLGGIPVYNQFMWAAEKTVENLPFMATAMTGSLAGGAAAIGLAGRKLGQKGIQNAVKRHIARMGADAAEDRVKKQLAYSFGQKLKSAGAKAGLLFTTGALESGSNYGELIERGKDNWVSSVATGMLSGAIEMLGGVNVRVIDKALGRDKGITWSKAVGDLTEKVNKGGKFPLRSLDSIKNIAKEMAETSVEEATQEAFQELSAIANIAYNDPTFEMFSAETLMRIGEAAGAGAAVGGMMSGGMRARSMPYAVARAMKSSDINEAYEILKNPKASTPERVMAAQAIRIYNENFGTTFPGKVDDVEKKIKEPKVVTEPEIKSTTDLEDEGDVDAEEGTAKEQETLISGDTYKTAVEDLEIEQRDFEAGYMESNPDLKDGELVKAVADYLIKERNDIEEKENATPEDQARLQAINKELEKDEYKDLNIPAAVKPTVKETKPTKPKQEKIDVSDGSDIYKKAESFLEGKDTITKNEFLSSMQSEGIVPSKKKAQELWKSMRDSGSIIPGGAVGKPTIVNLSRKNVSDLVEEKTVADKKTDEKKTTTTEKPPAKKAASPTTKAKKIKEKKKKAGTANPTKDNIYDTVRALKGHEGKVTETFVAKTIGASGKGARVLSKRVIDVLKEKNIIDDKGVSVQGEVSDAIKKIGKGEKKSKAKKPTSNIKGRLEPKNIDRKPVVTGNQEFDDARGWDGDLKVDRREGLGKLLDKHDTIEEALAELENDYDYLDQEEKVADDRWGIWYVYAKEFIKKLFSPNTNYKTPDYAELTLYIQKAVNRVAKNKPGVVVSYKDAYEEFVKSGEFAYMNFEEFFDFLDDEGINEAGNLGDQLDKGILSTEPEAIKETEERYAKIDAERAAEKADVQRRLAAGETLDEIFPEEVEEDFEDFDVSDFADSLDFKLREPYSIAETKPKVRHSKAKVKGWIRKLTGHLSVPVGIVEFESQLPKRVQEMITPEAKGRVKGIFDPTTYTAYIITSKVADQHDAYVTLMHETAGHYGLSIVLNNPNELNEFLDRMIKNPKYKDLINKVAGKHADLDSLREAAEEILADEVANQKYTGQLWEEFVSIIKQILRRLGLNNIRGFKWADNVTDAEIRGLLSRSRNAAFNGYKYDSTNSERQLAIDLLNKNHLPITEETIRMALSHKNSVDNRDPMILPLRYKIVSLWHGTGVIFRKFDKDFFYSGEGDMIEGVGFYLTDSQDDALEYGEQYSRLHGTKPVVYSVEIVPRKGQVENNFIERGKTLDDVSVQSIRKALKKIPGINNKIQEVFPRRENVDLFIHDRVYGSDAYNFISDVLGSQEEASQFLFNEANIDGIVYNIGDITNYVVFDESIMRITDKTVSEGTSGLSPRYSFVVQHGSGRLFDRHKEEYVGTAEGTADRGWGFYFTNMRQIAEFYARDNYIGFGDPVYSFTINGKNLKDILDEAGVLDAASRNIGWALHTTTESQIGGETLADALESDGIRDRWLKSLNNDGKNKDLADILINTLTYTQYKGKTRKQINKILDSITDSNVGYKRDAYIYTVTIHKGKTPDQYDYLYWDEDVPKRQQDKILNAMSEEQKKEFNSVNPTAFKNGGETYRTVARVLGGKTMDYKAASMFLLDAGIDGTNSADKLLSDNYDSAGNQLPESRHREIVVFDPRAITIEKIEDIDPSLPDGPRVISSKLKYSMTNASVENPQKDKDLTTPEYDIRDSVSKQFYDKFAAIFKMGESFGMGPYLEAERYQNLVANMVDSVNHWLVEGQKSFMRRLTAAGYNLKDIGEYLYALHAQERNETLAEKKRLKDPEADISDIQSGMSTDEAKKILEDYKDDKVIQAFAKEFKENIIDPRRELLFKMGIYSTETYIKYGGTKQIPDVTWEVPEYRNLRDNAWKNYVPLKGFDEDIDTSSSLWKSTKEYLYRSFAGQTALGDEAMFGKKGQSQGSVDMLAFGRESKAYNPFIMAIVDYQRAILEANKKPFLERFLRIVRNNKGKGWAYAKQSFTPKLDQEGEIEYMVPNRRVRVKGTKNDFIDPKGQGTVKYIHQYTVEEEHELTRDDGTKYKVTVPVKKTEIVLIDIRDKTLLESVKQLGVMKSIPIISDINQFFREINTQLNPSFSITNPLRDLLTSSIHIAGDYGFKFVKDIWKELPTVAKGVYMEMGLRGKPIEGNTAAHDYARTFREVRRAGGKAGWVDFRTPDELAARAIREVKRIQNPNKARDAIKGFKRFMDAVNTTGEMMVRVAIYKKLRDMDPNDPNKPTKLEAISYMNNVTVNFTKKGNLGGFIDSLFLFFNASLQSAVRIGSAMGVGKLAAKAGYASTLQFDKAKEVKPLTQSEMTVLGIVGSLIGSGVALTMLAYAFNDERDKFAPYVKDNFWAIPIPGTSKSFTIRLPYGYNFFNTVGNVIAELYLVDKIDHSEATGRIMESFMGAFSPVQGGSLSQFFAPTVIDPLVQISENKNFAGSPIYKEQSPFGLKPDYQMHFNSVTMPSKKVTEWLNSLTGGSELESGLIDVNPETWDHMFDQVTGGLGRFVSRVLNGMFTTGVDLSLGRTPSITSKDIPVYRQFIQGGEEWVPRNAAYELVKESAVKEFNNWDKNRLNRNITYSVAAGMEQDEADKLLKEFERNQKKINALEEFGRIK